MSIPWRLVMGLVLGGLALFGPGCSKDVDVGVIVSESGSLASYGKKVRNALELAADEINAAGGVQGGKILLHFKDDATNAHMGEQAVNELIDEQGVSLIIGAISSTVMKAIAPICEREKVILLSPAASAPEITDMGMYIYRNYPSDILEGTSMARLAKDLGLERVVIFSVDNDYGRGLSQVFAEQYQSRFRQVIKSFTFPDGDTSGFAQMVEELRELNPDGIYIVSYQGDKAQLLEQLHDGKTDAVLMGSSSVTPEMIRNVGEAGENLVYPQPSTLDTETPDRTAAAFVDAYRQRYGADPDIYAAHGYDALHLLVEAMRIGGGQRPSDVMGGLAAIKDFDGAAGKSEFDENGDVIRYPRLFIIRDGAPVPYHQFVDEGGSLVRG